MATGPAPGGAGGVPEQDLRYPRPVEWWLANVADGPLKATIPIGSAETGRHLLSFWP